MKKEGIIVLAILIVIFVVGCTPNNGNLPSAISGTEYSYPMPALKEGNGPYNCAITSDSILPGTLTLNECILSGTVPTLEGMTEKIFTFKYTVTDANGIVYGPFDAVLPVTTGPPRFEPPELPDAEIGKEYNFNFCDYPSSLECGQSAYVFGGAGAPLTFSATDLPLGFFLDSSGRLYGTAPENSNEEEKIILICAIDSSYVEDCKYVKLSIKKETSLVFKLNMKATRVYHGETNLGLPGDKGGGTRVLEDASIEWGIEDAIITLKKTNGLSYLTSDDLDVKTDETGYSSVENFRKKSIPIKAKGSAAISYDFSIPENGECVADTSTGDYDLMIPFTLSNSFNSKISISFERPIIETGNIGDYSCRNTGVADYILKAGIRGMPIGFLVTFENDEGTVTGQNNNPAVYTYSFGAADGGTNSETWTVTLERV